MLLQLLALGAGLAKARSDDHGRFDAALRTFLDGGHRLVAADDDERELGHLGQRAQAGVGLVSLDLVAAGVDREDAALVAMPLHVQDGAATDLVDVVRCANDGHGARVERGSK
ncbi:hypothetical protein SDC9_86053 [bioreactor metagenome]|uniref:Uncharacterized protein n=1 Tax=bioreactor metagenome TaxID=1076179 RepID=A0A644ZEX3_9ZZZZ